MQPLGARHRVVAQVALGDTLQHHRVGLTVRQATPVGHVGVPAEQLHDAQVHQQADRVVPPLQVARIGGEAETVAVDREVVGVFGGLVQHAHAVDGLHARQHRLRAEIHQVEVDRQPRDGGGGLVRQRCVGFALALAEQDRGVVAAPGRRQGTVEFGDRAGDLHVRQRELHLRALLDVAEHVVGLEGHIDDPVADAVHGAADHLGDVVGQLGADQRVRQAGRVGDGA